jgi:iron complex transport system substrate-binding protein
MEGRITRRAALAGAWLLATGVGTAGTGNAQSQATPGASPSVAGGTRTVEHARGSADIPANPQRVLALGEEFLLADLLTLGIPVVASSATVASEGFVGLDAFDTSGIDVFDGIEPDLERLAALAPDLIVAGAYVWDQIGESVLTQLAPTVVVDATGADWRTELLALGEMLGAGDRAQAALDGYEAAVTGAREELAAEGRTVSIATIYPGDSVAVWIDGPVNIPQTVLDLGFTLEPGPGSLPEAQNGRAFISLEQLALLTGDDLLALQSDLVEGEQESFDAFLAQPLWQSLPAVAAGRVHVLDRLGYPGVAGRTRLVSDLVTSLGTG